MNVLKPHLRITIETLLARGVSHREIARRTGVDRKTIRRYADRPNSPTPATGSPGPADQSPPPRPPAPAAAADPAPPGDPASARSGRTPSACEPHRAWIEAQVELGRNAVSLYQDLVEQRRFAHRYNSVKRFVARGPDAGARAGRDGCGGGPAVAGGCRGD